MKIGLSALRRVEAAGQQIFEIEGAGERALRHDLRPYLVDRIHDLLERHQEAGDRDRPLRIDDRALGRDDLEARGRSRY